MSFTLGHSQRLKNTKFTWRIKVRSVHHQLSERLHQRAGLTKPARAKFNPLDLSRLEQTEWSSTFERLMRNRLIMGAMRYETFEEKRQRKAGTHWDLVASITKLVNKYEATGNTEYLVDAANYCLLAFEFDPHPTKHFEAVDGHDDHCKPK